MFQSAIKINQFQFWSFVGKIPRVLPYFLAKNRSFSLLFNLQSKSINLNVGHFSAKYQGYSLTFWPKIAHFHHFSICNQTQSLLMLVIFRQNTKVIALLFGQESLIFLSCVNLQSKSINFNFVSFWQNTKLIALLFGQKSFICITFQSAIKMNQFDCWSFFGKIPRLQPYFLAKSRSLFYNVSICNQNQSISMLVSFRQNTKVIALLFGQKSHILITFQSAIKINQFQCWSSFGKIPRLQPCFLAKSTSFSTSFNLQSKSINFQFGQLSAKYQGYSLTFWPKIAHFHHFSIYNQHQSISILVIFRQNTKVIALLFGQKSLIFITCQSAIKIKQF